MPEYAAVIIPTLNRINHLRCALESLKKCVLADKTDVYIGLDYPPSEKYMEGYKKVCEYFETKDFSMFSSFNVIKRTENYGATKNLNELQDYVFGNHSVIIIMEDDIEVSVNFLLYINSALDYYKDDKNVIAVSGYSYPVPWVHEKERNCIKSNYVASVWGIGFWKDKYYKFRDEITSGYMFKTFRTAYKIGKLENMTDACFADYVPNYLAYVKSGMILDMDSLFCRPTDICLRAYLTLADKYVIIPTLSHTRNHGFDGSGLFCPEIEKDASGEIYADNYDYENQLIDNSINYSFNPSVENYLDQNHALYNCFDRRDKGTVESYMKEVKKCMIFGTTIYRLLYNIRCYGKAAFKKLKRSQDKNKLPN